MNIDFLVDINNCIAVLQHGGLIVYPTDTIWGIGCDATNAEAIAKIYKLKKRDESKAMIVLVADAKDLSNYVVSIDLSVFDYLKTVRKPTTIIYSGIKGLAENLIAQDKTAAIRVVQDEFCKQLIKQFGKPLVSTSANISGQPFPQKFSDIDINIINKLDYVVQYRRNDQTQAIPSSIVKWNIDGSVQVIRS